LPNYSEADLLVLLDEERLKHRRVSMLERIHQRYCTMRANRERLEILKEGKKP
jgi:outer membrane protein TolC